MNRKIFVLLLGCAACIAMVTVFGENGILKVLAQRNYLSDLQDTTANIRQENRQFSRQVEGLKNDPRVIEKIAREKLGMAKKGEIIFSFKNVKPSGPGPASK